MKQVRVLSDTDERIVRRFQEFKQRLIFTGDFQDTFSHSDWSIRLIESIYCTAGPS